ncbi:hypothetical protein C8R45DRAFT_1102149 [Mycena sanguinolenta]|nr:hypothetical protein C8R45DRAFT_1102149 [Mycena sanguinolenta]
MPRPGFAHERLFATPVVGWRIRYRLAGEFSKRIAGDRLVPSAPRLALPSPDLKLTSYPYRSSTGALSVRARRWWLTGIGRRCSLTRTARSARHPIRALWYMELLVSTPRPTLVPALRDRENDDEGSSREGEGSAPWTTGAGGVAAGRIGAALTRARSHCGRSKKRIVVSIAMHTSRFSKRIVGTVPSPARLASPFLLSTPASASSQNSKASSYPRSTLNIVDIRSQPRQASEPSFILSFSSSALPDAALWSQQLQPSSTRRALGLAMPCRHSTPTRLPRRGSRHIYIIAHGGGGLTIKTEPRCYARGAARVFTRLMADPWAE